MDGGEAAGEQNVQEDQYEDDFEKVSATKSPKKKWPTCLLLT